MYEGNNSNRDMKLELVPVTKDLCKSDSNINEVPEHEKQHKNKLLQTDSLTTQKFCIEAKQTLIYQHVETLQCRGEPKFGAEDCSNVSRNNSMALPKMINFPVSTQPRFGAEENGLKNKNNCSYSKHSQLTQSVMSLSQNEKNKVIDGQTDSSKSLFGYFSTMTLSNKLDKEFHKSERRNGLDDYDFDSNNYVIPEREYSIENKDQYFRKFLLDKLTKPSNALPIEKPLCFAAVDSQNGYQVQLPTADAVAKWNLERGLVPMNSSVQS